MSKILEIDGISYELGENSAKVVSAQKDLKEAVILNRVECEGKFYPVNSIAKGAFTDCDSLESISLPFVGSDNTVARETLFGYIFGATQYEKVYEGDRYYGTDDIRVNNNNNSYVPKSLKTVIITDTVIGKQAFCGCCHIEKIVISNTVKSIEELAFAKCSSLTSIVIPGSVKYLGGKAFCDCVKLESVKIENGLETIYDEAFADCQSLTSIDLPDTIISVANNAFVRCNNLKYNKYCNCEYLGNSQSPYLMLVRAKSKKITSCKISSQTKIICDEAFKECKGITEVKLPKGVISIGCEAFARCSNLTSVILPKGLLRIDSFAFDYSDKLTDIIVPKSVEYIGSCAFRDCGTIYLEVNEPHPKWDRSWDYSNYHIVYGYSQD